MAREVLWDTKELAGDFEKILASLDKGGSPRLTGRGAFNFFGLHLWVLDKEPKMDSLIYEYGSLFGDRTRQSGLTLWLVWTIRFGLMKLYGELSDEQRKALVQKDLELPEKLFGVYQFVCNHSMGVSGPMGVG